MKDRGQAKYDAFAALKAEHPRQLEVHERVRQSLAEHRDGGGVTVLSGPTGVGKTNLVRCVRWEELKSFKAHPVAGHLPFIGVTAVPPQHDSFRFASLFRGILEEADEVLRDDHTRRPVPYRTSDALQVAAINVLRYRQPGVFCIDEAQHITYALHEKRLAAHLDLIKWVALETKVPVLMVGTYELLRFSRISGQLGRRVNHIAFTPYDWLNDDDRKAFVRSLCFLRDHLPVRLGIEIKTDTKTHDTKTDENLRYLYSGSIGSFGLLKEWLQKALYRCLDEERAVITLKDLKSARMAGGKLKVIAQEHVRGLEELRALEGDDCDLEQILGMSEEPTTKARAVGTPLPGTRKLGRDPVLVGNAA